MNEASFCSSAPSSVSTMTTTFHWCIDSRLHSTAKNSVKTKSMLSKMQLLETLLQIVHHVGYASDDIRILNIGVILAVFFIQYARHLLDFRLAIKGDVRIVDALHDPIMHRLTESHLLCKSSMESAIRFFVLIFCRVTLRL